MSPIYVPSAVLVPLERWRLYLKRKIKDSINSLGRFDRPAEQHRYNCMSFLHCDKRLFQLRERVQIVLHRKCND
jgi:hypothetical protein